MIHSDYDMFDYVYSSGNYAANLYDDNIPMGNMTTKTNMEYAQPMDRYTYSDTRFSSDSKYHEKNIKEYFTENDTSKNDTSKNDTSKNELSDITEPVNPITGTFRRAINTLPDKQQKDIAVGIPGCSCFSQRDAVPMYSNKINQDLIFLLIIVAIIFNIIQYINITKIQTQLDIYSSIHHIKNDTSAPITT